MANDSSTGGFLVPLGEVTPTSDQALDLLFQATVAGVTNLPGPMVRPAYQTIPPVQPGVDVDWCGVHEAVVTPDDNTFEEMSEDGCSLIQIRHEEIEVLTSFYGPNALFYARRLRNGLAINQNTEALSCKGIKFVETHAIRRVPEQVNKQWVERQDMPITFRRKVTETYPILSLKVAGVHAFDDTNALNTVIPAPPGTALVPDTNTNPVPSAGT